MRYFSTLLIFLSVAASHKLTAFDIPTREETSLWLQDGKEIGATHMLVICDHFDYSDFPDYVYHGQDLQKKIDDWNAQELFMVTEVFHINSK